MEALRPRSPASRFASFCAILAVPCAILLALGLCWQHLSDIPWGDELCTLNNYATGQTADALNNYNQPNNHILFSFAFGKIRSWAGLGPNEFKLMRLTIFGFFTVGLVTLYFAAKQLFDRRTAIFTVFLFATSHIILSFATEIRGYCFSWMFTGTALYAVGKIALLPQKISKTKWFVLYGISAAISVGILPTNLFVFATICVWWLIQVSPQARILTILRDPLKRKHALLLALLPFTGLLFLLPVLNQLSSAYAGGARSDLLRSLRDWVGFGLKDFWWILLLSALGLLKQTTRKSIIARFRLLLCVLVLPLVLILPMPYKPDPRVWVPLYPLTLLAIAAIASTCLSAIQSPKYLQPVLRVFLIMLLCGLGYYRETTAAGYFTRNPNADRSYNIYDQWFQYNYDIVNSVNDLGTLAHAEPIAVLIGDANPMSYFWYLARIFPDKELAGVPIVWSQTLAKSPAIRNEHRLRFQNRKIIAVATDKEEALKCIQALGAKAQSVIAISVRPLGNFSLFQITTEKSN